MSSEQFQVVNSLYPVTAGQIDLRYEAIQSRGPAFFSLIPGIIDSSNSLNMTKEADYTSL